jgi:hypothetical protein
MQDVRDTVGAAGYLDTSRTAGGWGCRIPPALQEVGAAGYLPHCRRLGLLDTSRIAGGWGCWIPPALQEVGQEVGAAGYLPHCIHEAVVAACCSRMARGVVHAPGAKCTLSQAFTLRRECNITQTAHAVQVHAVASFSAQQHAPSCYSSMRQCSSSAFWPSSMLQAGVKVACRLL